MHTLITTLTTALILLASVGAGSEAVAGTDPQARIGERHAEFVAAMNAHDADALAELFADDALLHVANMPPVTGRGAIGAFYARLLRFLDRSEVSPERLEVSAAGDMAFAAGSVSNTFRGPNGGSEHAGKYVLVWRLIDGDWQVALYAVSSNQAAAAESR